MSIVDIIKIYFENTYFYIEVFGGFAMPKRIAILGGPRCGKTTLIQSIGGTIYER